MTARFAHLSDLHFGAEDPAAVDAIRDDLRITRPDVLAISGDLTQRARRKEFAAARAFLKEFDVPKVVVPGNHDIPFYDVARRFLAPLDRFRKYIAPVVDPFYIDDDLALLGLNTARSLTWKNGRVSEEQIARLAKTFKDVPDTVVKGLVTHHPFIPPKVEEHPPLVGRARQALRAFEGVGGDLLLCGHLHVGYMGEVGAHHIEIKRSIMAIQAGTALSHRRRGETNAYNLVQVDGKQLRIEVRGMRRTRFKRRSLHRFRKKDDRWVARAAPRPST